jgi:hypothetical protein
VNCQAMVGVLRESGVEVRDQLDSPGARSVMGDNVVSPPRDKTA